MGEKNIYQKLVEVRKSIDSFNKDSTGYGYKYVSGSQVLSAIKGAMDKEGVILATNLISPVVGQSSKGWMVNSKVTMIWINADKPEDRLEVSWFMAGEQKDPSQAFGSALTYMERYFLLKFFGIPTDEDDPDNPGKDKGNGNGKGNGKGKGKDKTPKTKTWTVGNIEYTAKDVGELMLKHHQGDRKKATNDWNLFKDLDKEMQISTIEGLLEGEAT